MTNVPSWCWELCAEISTAPTADQARAAVWNAFDKISALPPDEHVVASNMISAAMRGRERISQSGAARTSG
jgi:hypothetical protein